MRTRNQKRNFGIDITNNQSFLNSNFSYTNRSRKIEPQPKAYEEESSDIKVFAKNKKNIDQIHIIQRLNEIISFGYKYFEDKMGEAEYVATRTSDLSQKNQQQCQINKYQELMFPKSPQLTQPMRNILVQWLVEVHANMGLRYQTLFMTIFLVDRFCARKNVNKVQYQLLAMACLFLAGKYEEVSTPKIKRIITLCDKLYEAEDVLRMQSQVLLQLNFKISQPSLNWFIGIQTFAISNSLVQQYNSVPDTTFQKFKRVCYYLTELCLFQIQILKKFSPQVISNSVIYATSMKNEFSNILTKQSSKYLNAAQLKQMKECTCQVKKTFQNRFNLKYISINKKYTDLASDHDL